jgi:aspartyl-tRNA(Asn)/glutamyl-tRNA(Gln) amidotransferase subunit A
MELLTIAEASALIAARKLSPVELTKACLSRIKALDDELHSFLLVTEERALADASAAEAAIMADGPKGPLHGIPIGLKDIFKTKGIRTTAHSAQLANYVPAEDATSVELLAGAGTVLMGKLATHEFALGGPSFDLPWPPAHNPWNPAHFTGGSSSGTGAAVAAGLVLGGMGSDTGGSIRGPSALCGIAGIKPTYGRVSRAGVLPLSFALDHAGPMARTVEDCAIMLQALAGHDPRDPASANKPVPDFRADFGKGVGGLKIGVIRHFYETDETVSPATRNGIDDAIKTFGELGAQVRQIKISPLQDWGACGWVILMSEAFAVHEAWMKTSMEKYGERLRDRLLLGGLLSGSDYVQAVRQRRQLCEELACAAAEVDILLTATQPAEAMRIDCVPKWMNLERPSFTIPFNISGYPAMSVCSGFGEGGLPVAIQLVAKPFDEATLLRAGYAFEQATPWSKERPSMTRIASVAA